MKTEYWLPVAMMLQSIVAGVIFALKGDFRHAIYFLAGAACTAAATF